MVKARATDLISWLQRVAKRGALGPSPGVAYRVLGCTRTTVDHLVRAGVLERSSFEGEGHKVVMISSRSMEVARANKLVTGFFSGRRVGRPEGVLMKKGSV